MNILGISAFYHDSAAAIVRDGRVVAAAQEERFTRKKQDSGFPVNAVKYCLESQNLKLSEVDAIVFYEKPLVKFERLLETYLQFAPQGFKSFAMAMPLWLREKLFQKSALLHELRKIDPDPEFKPTLLFTDHHQSHAASAFYCSPFSEAIVLTMDGVGEWATTSVSIGHQNQLDRKSEIHFPHSLGLLYSAFTYYTGFKVNSGEYKVMGLAPYGQPVYVDLIFKHLIDLKEDGSFRLDVSYFNYCVGLTMTNEKFDSVFGGPPRSPESPLTQRHMDLAASIQKALEIIVLKIGGALAKKYPQRNLCLAGGVALNCVANGKLLKSDLFENIWIQPAAGDAGGAAGAALAAYFGHFGQARNVESDAKSIAGSYLGPEFGGDAAARLQRAGAKFEVLDFSKVLEVATEALDEGKAVGWFHGRMEFGPRALGNRSILGDPRKRDMQSTLNLRIKFRESFRPFAPAVRAEDVSDWFDIDEPSPYMLLVADVLEKHRLPMNASEQSLFGIEKLNVPRSSIPAITHVDYSARLQTVHAETNPRFHQLLSTFKDKTGCPILINTSFNVRGEPIVCTPEDAFRCFMGTEIEMLVVENCVLRKEQQDSALKIDYKNEFSLD